MTSGNSWLGQCVQRHPVRSGYLLFALFLILNAAVNVSSIWTAEQRQPGGLDRDPVRAERLVHEQARRGHQAH
ncbi:MAG: hypothetical protein ACK4ML_16315, partial [Alishewanella aestuarii]